MKSIVGVQVFGPHIQGATARVRTPDAVEYRQVATSIWQRCCGETNLSLLQVIFHTPDIGSGVCSALRNGLNSHPAFNRSPSEAGRGRIHVPIGRRNCPRSPADISNALRLFYCNRRGRGCRRDRTWMDVLPSTRTRGMVERLDTCRAPSVMRTRSPVSLCRANEFRPETRSGGGTRGSYPAAAG